MSKYNSIFFLSVISIFTFSSQRVYADLRDTSGLKITAHLPFLQAGEWQLGCLVHVSDKDLVIRQIHINGFLNENDSTQILLFRKTYLEEVKVVKDEFVPIDIKLHVEDENDYISEIYKDKKFQKTGVRFPGMYLISVNVLFDSMEVKRDFYFEVSDEISLNSNLGKDISDLFTIKKSNSNTINGRQRLNSKKSGLKKIDLDYGTSHVASIQNDNIIFKYYYLNKYLGSYKVSVGSSHIGQVINQYENLKNEIQNQKGFSLNPLMFEFKKLSSQDNEDRVLEGNINISSYGSNEKDEMSNMDNNYLDIQGDISLPVFGIPVQVIGYYTTQDINRTVKSSFINIKYDHNAAKEKAQKMLGAFKDAYGASQNQLQNYKMTYGSFITTASSQSDQIQASLNKEFGSEVLNSYQSDSKEATIALIKNSLINALGNNMDSVELALKAEEQYSKMKEQYQKFQSLMDKAIEYSRKIEQLQENLKIDSALVMSKLNGLDNYSEMTNKDLLKAGSTLLPNGKAKTFLSGLTNLEGGIFNKYVSKYTLAGQTIKGVNIGYDINIAEIEGTYGNTEYIDRLGNIEQYKTISMRVNSKEFLNQKISIGYNTITPSKAIVSDNDFLNYGKLVIPSFLNSVNIYSVQHTGTFISDNLSINIDAAYSEIQKQPNDNNNNTSFREQLAILGELVYQIPKTDFAFTASYEGVGKDFTNHALPVSLNGIQKMSSRLTGSILQSKIIMGLEYHYMLQNNLYSKGKQSRYGFDFKTNFKRVPNISVSYKPFTTIRNPYDTLSIQQKAVVGDLLIGRIQYQYKNSKNNTLRLALIYNRSRSFIDTSDFQNTLFQGTISLNTPIWSIFTNVGFSSYQSNYLTTNYPLFDKIQYLMTQVQYKIKENVNVGGGFEITKTRLGISRIGWSGNISYRFLRMPLSISLTGRYNSFILQEYIPWKSIYGAGLGISYRLFQKLN